MNDLPDTIEQLGARLKTLERRVCALEHPPVAVSPAPAQTLSTFAPVEAAVAISHSGGLLSVFGKAMLGIAGAYLFRAVAETNMAPQSAVASFAIVYAILWLVWAARTRMDAWYASAAYACTSALILAPMLWELTLRFKVLPAAATAGALAAFVIAAFTLSWKHDRAPVLWIATITATALAVTLAIASRQLVPFAWVLLLIVLLSECGAAFHRWSGIRVLAAAAADLIVLLLIYIDSSPQSTRVDYPLLSTAALLAPGIALFLIYAAAILFKTAMRRNSLTAFETIQATIAFLLSASSMLCFGSAASAALLGNFCLLLCACGYISLFTLFSGKSQARNHSIFATWSAALFLSGCALSLPGMWMAASLGAAAVAAAIASTRFNRLALGLHSAAFLLASVISSGLLMYLVQALAGTMPGAPSWNMSFIPACAVLCYLFIQSEPSQSWKSQALHLIFALVASAATTALLVKALAGLITLWMLPGAHHLAFIRTLILCVASLALAFGGAVWRRVELTHIGYAALALIAVKLVMEDLPLGHLAYIAASIFLFALTLIAVPRIAHLRRRT